MSASEPLTVGSLFSGIGGLDLGLERAGMKVIWQSELDPYASRVLAKHWPDVPNLGDITKVDWSAVERPDLICGGFPCQPWSVAGRRLGKEDERWLWPEFAGCVRHVRPDYVLVENVPGLLVGGLGDVLGGLAEMGFDADWACLPAAAVGAPHLRWRVFVLAYSSGKGLQGLYQAGRRIHLQSAPPDSRRQWSTEPDMARVANGLPHRVDGRIPRTKALGNAVVPQVAEYIGRLIVDANNA